VFFDRPDKGSRTLIVYVRNDHSELATLEEIQELALSAELELLGHVESARREPHPKTFVGEGKLAEILEAAQSLNAQLVLFSEDLSPAQERNLEGALNRRVLSRTGLILEIFAQRARTHEGQLQVELAQIQHSASRLVRGWTHLDRQRGGMGAGLGGAGETQLEADQRLLAARRKKLSERLARVRRQRAQSRRSRKRSETPTIALAGYTNAGKSSLFNRLTQGEVYAADQLFATLDPTLRQLNLPIVGRAILSDTVGFIRDLPHALVEAFKATLEEVAEADLILHVVDAAAPELDSRIQEVNDVLIEIGAESVPQLLVYNKVDALHEPFQALTRNRAGLPTAIATSCLTGFGFDLLEQTIAELLADQVIETTVLLAPHQGLARARCFELAEVREESANEAGEISLRLRIEKKNMARLETVLATG
jgi:GTP-binding protein HflX